MNVSRAGMAQPSFKGWITDGQKAVRDDAVVMINSSSPSSYASLRLFDGKEVSTRLNVGQLMNSLDKAKAEGVCKLPMNSFYA